MPSYSFLKHETTEKEDFVKKERSFGITQNQVLAAYKCVKANQGAAGIDGIEFGDYEKNLKGNLYKLWNRMASGSYFPKAVRGVEIPKKNGKKRLLGIPTIADRTAQMVVKMALEPEVEPMFYNDSYGYRPGKSAIDAIGVARGRNWKHPWVIDFDIVGLFDNIDHEMMMKVVRAHAKRKWMVLYVERFLKAPIQMPNGEVCQRTSGTPQGGVISPLLANMFLHYVFDRWMTEQNPNNPWVRYADDGIVHCRSKTDAETLLIKLRNRMERCKLEIHPEKTRIVFCKSDNVSGSHEYECYDFLGYTFRQRYVKSKSGELFVGFTPAVSKAAAKQMRAKVRSVSRGCTHLSIVELAERLNPILRGWINYFRAYNAGVANNELNYVNMLLVRWIKKKFKTAKNTWKHARKILGSFFRFNPNLFVHWQHGVRPTIG